MKSSRPGPWLTAAVVSVVACSEPQRLAVVRQPTRTDSAGFTIVANTAAATDLVEVFTVEPRPRLSIGALDGPPEVQFSRVGSAARLDNGRIAVANGQPMELRIFG